MVLYNTAITNQDVRTAMQIAGDLVTEATYIGQALQATRMLKKMTPDGQLYYLEKSSGDKRVRPLLLLISRFLLSQVAQCAEFFWCNAVLLFELLYKIA